MSYDPPSDDGWDQPPGPPPGSGPTPGGAPQLPPPPAPGGWLPPPPPPPPGYGPPPGGYGPPPGGYGGYPPSGGYPSSGGYQPYPPPDFGVYPGPARTDGTAIAALVLAICSFVICPLIPAVVALALIPGSRAKMRASGGAVQGEGLLTAAKIIALINIGFAAIGVIAIVIGLAVSSTSGGSSLGHLAPLPM